MPLRTSLRLLAASLALVGAAACSDSPTSSRMTVPVERSRSVTGGTTSGSGGTTNGGDDGVIPCQDGETRTNRAGQQETCVNTVWTTGGGLGGSGG